METIDLIFAFSAALVGLIVGVLFFGGLAFLIILWVGKKLNVDLEKFLDE